MAQLSLIPQLDAATAYARADSDKEALVRRYLRDAIMEGVGLETPDCIIAVTHVDQHGPGRILADVILFDGGSALIELRLPSGAEEMPGVQWFADDGAVPFGWDARNGRWRRFPENVGENSLYLDPFEREAQKEAKAARRRAGYAKAAETRARNRAAKTAEADLRQRIEAQFCL